MGKKIELLIFNRTTDQLVPEEMFKICSHRRNANQNNTDIVSHFSQKGNHQEGKQQ
jgi:hypothetical protein